MKRSIREFMVYVSSMLYIIGRLIFLLPQDMRFFGREIGKTTAVFLGVE